MKVTGGWGSAIPIGDVNEALKSFNDNEVFEYWRRTDPSRVIGEIKTLDRTISHWEAELRFDLTRRIGFGIATSAPFRTRNQNSLTHTIIGWAGPQIEIWTFSPEIKVGNPIKLSAYYTLPLIVRMNMSLGGGVGLYPARISFPIRYEEIDPSGSFYWATLESEAKQNSGLGFHANLIWEYSIISALALVAEFQWAHAKIRGFKGTNRREDHLNSNEVRGTLYYFSMWNPLFGARHTYLEIYEKPPDYSIHSIRDLREATLDLSGYSFRLGLRLRLF